MPGHPGPVGERGPLGPVGPTVRNSITLYVLDPHYLANTEKRIKWLIFNTTLFFFLSQGLSGSKGERGEKVGCKMTCVLFANLKTDDYI